MFHNDLCNLVETHQAKRPHNYYTCKLSKKTLLPYWLLTSQIHEINCILNNPILLFFNQLRVKYGMIFAPFLIRYNLYMDTNFY